MGKSDKPMNPKVISPVPQQSRLIALHRGLRHIRLSAWILLPNLLIALHLRILPHQVPTGAFTQEHVLLWAGANFAALGITYSLRQWLLLPLERIAQQLQHLRAAYANEAGIAIASPLHVGRIASELGHFAAFALEHYRKHQEALHALEESRQIIAQFTLQQEAGLHSTHREIAIQYRAVLAYANYLDGQISSNKLDPTLRYDFDDICESSFNLKLIAGALSMLGSENAAVPENVPLAPLLQQTMIALAPALDRRSMKITSAEVDMSVAAHGSPLILNHVLWMMLLGMIRYAADESTLRIRTFHSRDGTQAFMSIVVSELSPSKLSESERSDYLARRLQHLTPHMFAETIRIHANVQLASLLLARSEGSISVLPLTVCSCEICVVIPSARMPQSSQ